MERNMKKYYKDKNNNKNMNNTMKMKMMIIKDLTHHLTYFDVEWRTSTKKSRRQKGTPKRQASSQVAGCNPRRYIPWKETLIYIFPQETL